MDEVQRRVLQGLAQRGITQGTHFSRVEFKLFCEIPRIVFLGIERRDVTVDITEVVFEGAPNVSVSNRYSDLDTGWRLVLRPVPRAAYQAAGL